MLMLPSGLSGRGSSHPSTSCSAVEVQIGLLQRMTNCLMVVAITPCHCDVGQYQADAPSAGQAAAPAAITRRWAFQVDQLVQSAVQVMSLLAPSRL